MNELEFEIESEGCSAVALLEAPAPAECEALSADPGEQAEQPEQSDEQPDDHPVNEVVEIVEAVEPVNDRCHESPEIKLLMAISDCRRAVAEKSQEILRLKNETKAARDDWKAETERLTELERKYHEGIALPYAAGVRYTSDDNGPGERAFAPTMTSAATGVPSAAAPPVDPATTTDLADLGITPDRLERLREADMGGGRNASTVADLEALIRDGRLQYLKSFGPKAVDAVTDALMAWRERNPVPVHDAPPADVETPATVEPVSSIEPVEQPKRKRKSKLIPPGCTSTTTPSGIAANDPEAVDPAAEPADEHAAIVSETEADSEEAAAYAAGCEAGVDEKPVTANPYKMGTTLWGCWDRGWQECGPTAGSE